MLCGGSSGRCLSVRPFRRLLRGRQHASGRIDREFALHRAVLDVCLDICLLRAGEVREAGQGVAEVGVMGGRASVHEFDRLVVGDFEESCGHE
ncbi:hypothetical protein GCM10009755_23220 [Brevibacterium samyangense]|uniref:FCD domain-containing protein n=1 Tax=Brevibacterium samyangense TaxID=366888 RepID=A0ABN2TJ63_9MICO